MATYPQNDPLDFPVSIAPMLDWTDRHYRYFMRKITKKTVLYTEMVVTGSIIHGDQDKLLGFDDSEHPIVLQLGGSSPEDLAKCARIGAEFAYDAINLNVGCPSDRVQNGSFGACLMANADLVRDCIQAVNDSVKIPVTVKHRIGIDDMDSYEFMKDFVQTVSEGGCNHFIVHARIAILGGLSPKDNRSVPPLRYDDVYRLKKELPHLRIEINGGIKTHAEILSHKKNVDAVMIGREAYDNPYLFAKVDSLAEQPQSMDAFVGTLTRRQIAFSMVPYMEQVLATRGRVHPVTRHMLGLMKGCRGGRRWRRILSDTNNWTGSMESLLENAMQEIPAEILDMTTPLSD